MVETSYLSIDCPNFLNISTKTMGYVIEVIEVD